MNHPEPIAPEALLKDLRPRAILRGFLWDNGLSIAIGLVLASLLLSEGFSGSAEEQVDALFASTRYSLLFLPFGLGCTVLGGFLAGSRAGVAPLKNGVAVGVANIALGLVALLLPTPGPGPALWVDLLGFSLVLPAAALGGVVAQETAARAK